MKHTGNDYISNQEYDEALRLYYNGLDFTKAIKPIKQKRSWYNPQVAEAMMLEGEEFQRLEEPERRVDHLVLTNLGRIINTNSGNIIAVKVTKNNILANFGGTSFSLEFLYKQTPWEYEYNFIINNYIENKWRIKSYTQSTNLLDMKK